MSKSILSFLSGADIDSINTLLRAYGIEFGKESYSGSIIVGNEKIQVNSAAAITKFPQGGYLFSGNLKRDVTVIDNGWATEQSLPLMGIVELRNLTNNSFSGSILAYGDTSCIETSSISKCFSMITDFIRS